LLSFKTFSLSDVPKEMSNEIAGKADLSQFALPGARVPDSRDALTCPQAGRHQLGDSLRQRVAIIAAFAQDVLRVAIEAGALLG
jgi:hypothetical protein